MSNGTTLSRDSMSPLSPEDHKQSLKTMCKDFQDLYDAAMREGISLTRISPIPHWKLATTHGIIPRHPFERMRALEVEA